jgi:hypothetical protein
MPFTEFHKQEEYEYIILLEDLSYHALSLTSLVLIIVKSSHYYSKHMKVWLEENLFLVYEVCELVSKNKTFYTITENFEYFMKLSIFKN